MLEWLVRVVCEVAQHKESNMMGLRNLTLVLAPNLLHAPPEKGPSPVRRAGPFRGSGSKRGSSSPAPAINPVEELLNIELVSNMLHTLAASSMRFSM